MKKWTLMMVLAVWGIFAVLPGPAWSAGLTIGDGASVYVRGGASISLLCQNLVIEAGGNMYLDHETGPGTLYKCGRVQVDPGGHLYMGGGQNCPLRRGSANNAPALGLASQQFC